MNHYEQGLSAFGARRFLEALALFEKAASEVPASEQCALAEHVFECAKVLNSETSWRYLRTLGERYREGKQWHRALAVLEREESGVPERHREFLHQLRADASFHLGELEKSRVAAIAHVDLLLTKKLYPQLVAAARAYQARFPFVIYFCFLEFEAHLALADYAQTRACLTKILEAVRRRWPKLEDAEHATKAGLLETLLASLQAHEPVDAAAVLQAHYVSLELCLLTKRTPERDDWKRALELLVYDDSWAHLKCVLELALLVRDEDLAQATFQRLRSKKGYSFVKLTRYEPQLKQWILGPGSEAPAPAPAAPLLTADELRLEQPVVPATTARDVADLTLDFDDDQELKAIERNTITQLQLQAISPELALDLLVSYQTMGFQRVVEWLLGQAEAYENLPRSLRRKFQYLRVVHALEKNQAYLALAVLEEMLGSQELSLDELKELKYAQGNVYLRLGDRVAAGQAFAEVAKLDPGYRQLAERMMALETN